MYSLYTHKVESSNNKSFCTVHVSSYRPLQIQKYSTIKNAHTLSIKRMCWVFKQSKWSTCSCSRVTEAVFTKTPLSHCIRHNKCKD